MLFYTSLAAISCVAKIDEPVTFLIYDVNDVDIQLILEFKKSFVKYHPVCPKNP